MPGRVGDPPPFLTRPAPVREGSAGNAESGAERDSDADSHTATHEHANRRTQSRTDRGAHARPVLRRMVIRLHVIPSHLFAATLDATASPTAQ